MTDDADVVIMDDTIRIQGETLERLETLAAILGASPHDALRIAVRAALAEARRR